MQTGLVRRPDFRNDGHQTETTGAFALLQGCHRWQQSQSSEQPSGLLVSSSVPDLH